MSPTTRASNFGLNRRFQQTSALGATNYIMKPRQTHPAWLSRSRRKWSSLRIHLTVPRTLARFILITSLPILTVTHRDTFSSSMTSGLSSRLTEYLSHACGRFWSTDKREPQLTLKICRKLTCAAFPNNSTLLGLLSHNFRSNSPIIFRISQLSGKVEIS